MSKRKKPSAFCHICQQIKTITDDCVKLPNRRIICEECKSTTELKVYRVGCFWHVISHFEIPARCLEEAITIAEDPDSPLPPDPDYVPDTFEILRDCCEELEGEEI
jgi:hypothetical protein